MATITKLNKVEIDLMARTAEIAIDNMTSEKGLDDEVESVKMFACDHMACDGSLHVQIQIIVTRDESDFLTPFDIEITRS